MPLEPLRAVSNAESVKNRSRSLVAVLTALAAQGACSVYGPDDLPKGPGGASNGGKVSDMSGGRTATGGSGPSLGGAYPGGSAGEGGQGDAGADTGGSASGGVTSSGGTGSSAGGAPIAGAGGAPPAGGAPSGGTPSGGAPTVAPELIDNMEDGNNQLYLQLARDGYWYTSADSAGSTIDPAPATVFAMPSLPSGETGAGGGSEHAFHFNAKGSTSTNSSAWGALGGFDFLHVASGMKQPYDAHLYKGIRFWAKATPKVTLRIRVPIRDTTSDAVGSKCGTKCDDHYLKQQEITPTWTEYVLPWTDLIQQGWGMAVPFDATSLIGVQFVVGPMLASDIWIDDVSFLPAQ